MNTIDKMNGYTLTRTNDTWNIETDTNTNVRIITTTTWDKFDRLRKHSSHRQHHPRRSRQPW